jgi:ribosomal protein S27AE
MEDREYGLASGSLACPHCGTVNRVDPALDTNKCDKCGFDVLSGAAPEQNAVRVTCPHCGTVNWADPALTRNKCGWCGFYEPSGAAPEQDAVKVTCPHCGSINWADPALSRNECGKCGAGRVTCAHCGRVNWVDPAGNKTKCGKCGFDVLSGAAPEQNALGVTRVTCPHCGSVNRVDPAGNKTKCGKCGFDVLSGAAPGPQALDARYGPINPVLVCPHCQQRGSVRTKTAKLEKGISGGKATGAILTGGLSAIVTGLSRKEEVTQAHCDYCNSTWQF